MIGLIQRVTEASVIVEGATVGRIDAGLLVLVGVERDDSKAKADKLLHKLLNYRVFADSSGKMNCSVKDVGGGLLLVSQFTLVADTAKGLRPGFSSAAAPELGEKLYSYLCQQAKAVYANVETGIFGADMKVQLINDGPVTFWLKS